jgi:hypothetical protein
MHPPVQHLALQIVGVVHANVGQMLPHITPP